jgi:hypothetical protein
MYVLRVTSHAPEPRRSEAFELSTFKLTDVESKVVFPAPKHASYIALNHVCGKAKMCTAWKKEFVLSKKRTRDGPA